MSMLKKFGPAASTVALMTLVPGLALAGEGGAAANEFSVKMWAAGGAGIAVGIGVLGGALGQGRAVAAALEGISRNPGAAPKIQPMMILGLALIESLVLFGFLIALILQAKF